MIALSLFLLLVWVTSETVNGKGKGDTGTTVASSLPGAQSFLRPSFEQAFHSKCSKYPFVSKHIEALERPPPRLVKFKLHGSKPGEIGGLGDRLAGLSTAKAMSLRLDRTLMIDANEAFDTLFRPYHPRNLVVNYTLGPNGQSVVTTKFNYQYPLTWLSGEHLNLSSAHNNNKPKSCHNIADGVEAVRCGAEGAAYSAESVIHLVEFNRYG